MDFLPQLNREQLARFFRLQHVCVFTSLHPEAFGIVAVEAMASGLALVSTGVGGASEVFENEISGLSYQAGDSKTLAEQLERLASESRIASSTSTRRRKIEQETNSALTPQYAK